MLLYVTKLLQDKNCPQRSIIHDSRVRTCTGWAKKTAHGFHCNNFAYSQSFFIIFGIYTL